MSMDLLGLVKKRQLTHVPAHRASRGAGWLVKNSILQGYFCNVIDNSLEGVILLYV